MAEIFTLLPILLLLMAVFNPIICSNSNMCSERRNSAPYIEPNEHSPQYLADAGGLGASRSRKVQNPVPPSPQRSFASNNQKTVHQSNDDENNEAIKRVFKTNFGPGLHLFQNTAPNSSPPYLNSVDMPADQPHAPPSPPSVSSPPSSSSKSSTEPGFFKVHIPASSVNSWQSPITDSPYDSLVDEETTTASPPSNALPRPNPIHFPLEEPEKIEINYTINSNDYVEKGGEPFCTKLRNYPEKAHLDRIIKTKFSNFEPFFGEDFVLPKTISQRMNDAPDEEFLCNSTSRVIYPEAGLNKEYNWMLLVNTAKYKQGILIEECGNIGSTCGENQDLSVRQNFLVTCEQNFIFRTLVAVGNERVILDQFKMPSCCKCVVKPIRKYD